MIYYLIFMPVWILSVLLLFLYLLYKFILTPYKLKTLDADFDELIATLNITIQTEFDLWEKNVFITKGAITNSNFDNYYDEMCTHIYKSLSPTFFERMNCYITTDAIISIIARKTKEYLTSKITGTV